LIDIIYYFIGLTFTLYLELSSFLQLFTLFLESKIEQKFFQYMVFITHTVQLSSTIRLCHVQRVSKNIPDVFSYNSRKHCRIFIIFDRNISEKASNQQMLYFSTSPN